MLTTKYSEPEFNPYGDGTDASVDDGPWHAPVATAPLNAVLRLPGSKSLTNRELVLAALADGPSVLRRPLHSRDTVLMVEALRSLGVTIEEIETGGEFGPDLRVTPAELTGGTSIECGLAGTVMRFIPPVAALALGPVAFDGDEAARRRPMRTTVDSLRALGVDVNDDGRGTLPFSLYGTGEVIGGEISVDASASSQFVSALLMAAPRFRDGLTLRHTGERLPSMPHIEMTIACLAARGVDVETPEPGVWIVPAGPIAALDVDIEPDLSNAGPFLGAALVAGGRVSIEGWPERTTQVGASMATILERMGGTVQYTPTGNGLGTLSVTGGDRILGIDLDEASELAPTVAAIAALADSTTVLTGIGHLRGHETDRLQALAAEINGLGGEVTETEDGLIIRNRELRAGAWHAYEDHRMATAGAIVGLRVPGVTVDDIGSTSKTLPQFVELWTTMLHGPATAASTVSIEIP